jgi:PRTRC genetic system protein E
MNTNFFNQIAQLDFTGNLQLTIAKGAESNLVVAVLLQNEQCGDSAKNMIPPLNLRGTAEQMDEGFFQQITMPLQTASGLMVNMEAFMKQMEEAKKQSAMEKEKTDKDKKVKEEKDKKYKEAMQKVDELEKEGKYRGAWMKVPDPAQFPEQEEVIRKRRTALSAKFAPDLFAPPVEKENTAEPQAEDTSPYATDHEVTPEEVEEYWENNEETEY